MRFLRLAARLAAIVGALASAGCSHVAPYQRGTLAHPTMTTEDMSTGLDEHVKAVSEGSEGGGLNGGGGGCGCN